MKVIIAGSRGFSNYDLLKKILDVSVLNKNLSEIEIVSGGAKGADQLGERYAKERGIKLTIMRPNWDLYGKAAGHRRNEEMAMYAAPDGGCICFWDSESRGTKGMIKYALQYKLKLRVVEYLKNENNISTEADYISGRRIL